MFHRSWPLFLKKDFVFHVWLRLDLHRRWVRRWDPTVCLWKKMRPGSIVVSGKKKRRSAHTETRRPGLDVLGMNRVYSTQSVGRKGRQFYRIFLYKLFPFTASCLLIAIIQSQELDFLQMTVLSDRQVPLAVWVAEPAKKRWVGSDRRARRQWSSNLSITIFCMTCWMEQVYFPIMTILMREFSMLKVLTNCDGVVGNWSVFSIIRFFLDGSPAAVNSELISAASIHYFFHRKDCLSSMTSETSYN